MRAGRCHLLGEQQNPALHSRAGFQLDAAQHVDAPRNPAQHSRDSSQQPSLGSAEFGQIRPEPQQKKPEPEQRNHVGNRCNAALHGQSNAVNSFIFCSPVKQLTGTRNQGHAKARLAQRAQAAGENQAGLRMGDADNDVRA